MFFIQNFLFFLRIVYFVNEIDLNITKNYNVKKSPSDYFLKNRKKHDNKIITNK